MKKISILAALVAISSVVSIAQASFSDVQGTPFQAAVNSLQQRGIVQGFAGNKYDPDKDITRGAFTKIILLSVGKTPSGYNCFPDVTEQWFAPYVCAAKADAILGGYANGNFGPYDNVTYAESLRIILDAYKAPVDNTIGGGWAQKYLIYAKQNNLGMANYLSSSDIITRGQMAQIVYWVSNLLPGYQPVDHGGEHSSHHSNPASKFCISKGGYVETRDDGKYCHLADGEICREWAYYNGTCPSHLGPGPAIIPPSCSISANPNIINYGDTFTLSWGSNHTTSAYIGNVGNVDTNGQRNLSPNHTTTYNMSVSGAGGSSSCSASVTVNTPSPAPTCSISANPSTINKGESFILEWDSNNATSAIISNIGNVDINGQRSISPSETTNYNMGVSGPGGSYNCSTSITVNSLPPLPPIPPFGPGPVIGGGSTANPASQYCTAKGGHLETREGKEYCYLKGGTVCEEWTYYNRTCPAKIPQVSIPSMGPGPEINQQ